MAQLKEYMTSNVEYCNSYDNLATMAKKMKEEDVGFIPVVDNDKCSGVVTDRDIVVKGLAKGSPEHVKAQDIMTENIVTGHPDMDVEEAAKIMQDHRIKRLLVLENDNIKGVVTLGDLGVENAEQTAGNIISEISKGEGNN
ncbi:CBS domain-containing protein [Salipaludibacillus aurantiacus]|uniref:CBS domain-containing protein n=1 Tax=Salipaludibacillus aurantiacus TaxID=1601833 RepID=A0A1H9SMG1_9BACI|nr:CBS domain-containing protein [Salipaludibacillus aurantiacus]SER85573.1 CBS domain-containing protein [Salipaludibacillus aurantiacus]